MLVPTMNDLEIYKEISTDIISVLKFGTTKLRFQTMVMKRTNNFRWVETIHFKTERNNHWSIVIHFDKIRKDINYYVTTEGKFGITAYSFIIVEQEMPWLFKYTPHFFKRYRERMELQETNCNQILKRFFKNNVRFTPVYTEANENHTADAAISMSEGIAYGKINLAACTTEVKTFLSHQMLNKGQRDLAHMLIEEEEEYRQGIEFIGDIKAKK